jgi:hypothetical protein
MDHVPAAGEGPPFFTDRRRSASGAYFYRLTMPERVLTRKMVLMR